jgi:hypothetical protein
MVAVLTAPAAAAARVSTAVAEVGNAAAWAAPGVTEVENDIVVLV